MIHRHFCIICYRGIYKYIDMKHFKFSASFNTSQQTTNEPLDNPLLHLHQAKMAELDAGFAGAIGQVDMGWIIVDQLPVLTVWMILRSIKWWHNIFL